MSEHPISPPRELLAPSCRLVKIEALPNDCTATFKTWRGKTIRITLASNELRDPLRLEGLLAEFGLLLEADGRPWAEIVAEATEEVAGG